MARRATEKDTLRNLALRSRNHCAFPGCSHPIMDDSNTLVAELCHIEAAEPGGERYNPDQTDDDRRAYGNLMFLCLRHHKVTNDTEVYTVEKMKEMKRTHEALPVSVHNPDKIVEAVSRLECQSTALQAQVEKFMGESAPKPAEGYAIHTPGSGGAWVPEPGKRYTYPLQNGGQFRVMMKGALAHIEHVMADGAIAYYEVDEQGSVKNSRWPYPLEAYELIIPPEMIVTEDSRSRGNGTIETRYVLKWAQTVTIIRDQHGRLGHADLQARFQVNHPARRIEIINV